MNKVTTESFKKRVFEDVGDEYTVLGEYVKNNVKIKMKHNKCGNIYYVTPGNWKSKHNRCPKHHYDSNKNRTSTNDFCKKVRSKYGNEFSIIGKYTTAHENITIKHNKCGRVFEMTPNNFLKRGFCSKCKHDNRKTNILSKSAVCDRIFEQVGNEYQLIGNYNGMHKKVTMLHVVCGNKYKVTPGNFLSGRRCPKCMIPHGETTILNYLKSNNVEYIYQYKIRTENRTLLPDFYLPEYNTFIEFDGEQHHNAKDFFGGKEGLRKTQERDALKNAYAYEHGIKMIRIPYYYLNNIEEFLEPFFANNEPVKKDV